MPLPDSLTVRTQGQLEKLHGVFQYVSLSNRTAPSQKSQSNRTALSQNFQYAVRGTVGKGGFGYTILAHMTTTSVTRVSSASIGATTMRKKKTTEMQDEKCERMVVMKVPICANTYVLANLHTLSTATHD
jgi:hypothetical protein